MVPRCCYVSSDCSHHQQPHTLNKQGLTKPLCAARAGVHDPAAHPGIFRPSSPAVPATPLLAFCTSLQRACECCCGACFPSVESAALAPPDAWARRRPGLSRPRWQSLRVSTRPSASSTQPCTRRCDCVSDSAPVPGHIAQHAHTHAGGSMATACARQALPPVIISACISRHVALDQSWGGEEGGLDASGSSPCM